MNSIASQVLETISAHSMIKSGDVICVAISGGSDSTALLAILNELKKDIGFTLKACHFDHRFRDDSANDSQAAKILAEKMNVEFVCGNNSDGKPSARLQERAREMRYTFFEGLIERGYANKIATGHTMNDSVETSLMWMLRGAGSVAFGGIPPVRGCFVRPLLNTKREDLLVWLKGRGVEFVNDPTNDTDDYLRNRIRHHVVPAILTESPSAIEAVSRLARIVKGEGAVVYALAISKLAELKISESDGHITIKPSGVINEPEALRWGIYRSAIKSIGVEVKNIELVHIEAVDNLLQRSSLGKSVTLPQKVVARIDHGGLTFEIKKGEYKDFSFPVSLEMKESLSLGKLHVATHEKNSDEREAIDFDKVPQTAVFRNRRPGDYLRLPNLEGRKKLKKFLIDKKIPSGHRNAMPFLADKSEILWVPNLYLSKSISATKKSSQKVFISWIID